MRVKIAAKSRELKKRIIKLLSGEFEVTEGEDYDILIVDRESSDSMHFRSIFENAIVGIYRTTPDGKVLMVNPFLVKLLGYDREEEVRERDLSKDEYFENGYERARFLKEIEEKGYFVGESAWKRKDGSTVWVRESAVAVRDNAGRTVYYEGIVEDITELKELIRKLEESERKYRELWENANDILYMHDLEGNILSVNKMATKLLGYRRDELENMNIRDLVEEEYVPVIMEGIRRIAETGKAQKEAFEILCRSKDGRKVWLEVRARPILEKGRVVAIHGIARDVTLKKELEKKLCESEEMFRKLAEKSLVGIYLIQDGVFKYVNPKLAELWGYKQKDLVGKSPLEFVHPDDRNLVDRNIRLRIEGKVESVNYTLKVVRGDGEVRICEVYGSRTIFKGKPAIIGTLIDVTEKIKMQEEVERLNKLLKLVNEINQITSRERDTLYLVREVVKKLSMFYEYVEINYEGLHHSEGVANQNLASLALPMMQDDEVRGEMIIRSSRGFLDDEREILQTLASDLALAIEASKTEEEKWIAFEQIERNIEHFAILADQIRNPLAAISILTEMELEGEVKDKIMNQIKRIEELLTMLDRGWLDSEAVREYLRRSWDNPKD